VLADFGLSVGATGFWGRDNEEPFRQLFKQRNIEDRMIRLDGSTRMCVKVVNEVEGDTTDINFPGLKPSIFDLIKLEEELEKAHAKWVVLAGSIPPGVSASIYSDLTRKLKKQGCKVALDASGPGLKFALESGPDALPHLVKPNLAELEEWTGCELRSPEAILEAAQAIVAQGVEQVMVSMGSEGALLVSRDDAIGAIPPAIEVGSTVGAGDALVAGLIAAFTRGMSTSESVRLATAFSVDVLMRSDIYALSPETVATWSRQVSIYPVHSGKRSASIAQQF
ncbi:1-phosphofructokinase family hexose kinase, partial [bacterium]